MHLMGAATFLEIWALFLYVSHHSEFLGALKDVCRNNNVLLMVLSIRKELKDQKKYIRISQPELSFLPVFLYVPLCFAFFLYLHP